MKKKGHQKVVFKKYDMHQHHKYNLFHKEQKRPFKENPFRRENMVYDADNDEYTCPAMYGSQYIPTGNHLGGLRPSFLYN
ncbi:MAG: hypothetical protein ACYC21_11885 [Eubacteriales bacterium]